MADTVPVSEVLCEAMEYLAKLGSNLRLRSENLKIKRLQKGKLKNAHAMQKAANKVLLICELSKKSILNVEVGVKKILNQIESSQGPDSSRNDGKIDATSSTKTTHTEIKYEYFYYNSLKLKIRNKVNVKHFMSVKVLAKAMPIYVQDKHPVYYNCKLYQARKKEMVIDENEAPATTIMDINLESDELDDKKFQDNEHSSSKNVSADESQIKILEDGKNRNDSSKKTKTENSSSSNEKKSKMAKKSQRINQIRSSSSDSEGNHKSSPTKSKNKQSSNSKINESDSDNECNKLQSLEHKNSSKSDTLDKDNSDCSQGPYREKSTNKNTTLETKNTNKEKNEQRDTNCMTPNSENDAECKENLNNCQTDKNEIENKHLPSENENSQCSNESKSYIKCVSIDKLLRKDKLVAEQKPATTIEIIDSDNENETIFEKSKKKMKKKSKSKITTGNILDYKKSLHSNKSKTSEDEDFWKQKREEVKAFKPKEFVINIDRLPKFTDNFLRTNELIRITENGSIVFALLLENNLENDLQIPDNNKTNSETIESNRDVNIKSNELKVDNVDNENINNREQKLDDKENSDLDCRKSESCNNENSSIRRKRSRETPNKETSKSNAGGNTSSKAMASDSSGEKKKRKGDTEIFKKVTSDSNEDANTFKKALLNDSSDDNSKKSKKSDGGTPKKETSENDDAITSKKALLYDSTDENSRTPKKKSVSKRKRKSSSLTPSKRKHIMESMRAKKMLLTYSSSSDTEDEELRKTIKGIRDSLLKGGSDVDDDLNGDILQKPQNSGDESNENHMESNGKSKSSAEEVKTKEDKSQESDTSTKDTSSQVGDNTDARSNSSSSKMGRSKHKPGDSSSQNTDTQESIDRDIDGLTNLKTLSKKHRRRLQSPSTDCTQSTRSSRSARKMPKRFNEDALLKAESSSDAASIADSDVGEEVEIPAESVTGLNGDSMGHLAKDDLLEDSNSSDVDKSSQEIKNEEDDSDDHNVKSKRRKAHAISSDSEVGGSRKKDRDRDVKLSDFEDSDDDSNSEPKKTKRKKKLHDSDASVSSSVDGSKKKRRRIKKIDDSEDGSGSESETEGRNKHGRKNIRKVMGKNQLEEATKKAAREEKERIARIAERQKLYNNLQFDESGKPDEVVLDKVVLDFDPETKEPLIEVDKGLVKKLKPHQANGIKFMWDACFESVKRIKKDKGSGCILAHCMGLGKTLQVVSLTHTLLTHSSMTKVNRVLVVCPLSTVLNWVNEYRIWLKHADNDFEVDVYELSRHKQNSERAWQLQQWYAGGGVCVLGYEMFRNLSADNVKKFKKKMLKNFQEALVDPGPDLVVCDEGHLLKNEKTSLSQAMNRVKTLRRIVLTGTPLQNNLKEYYCMVQFVKPNLLGKYNEYLNRFVNPITNGQYTDSTEHDIKIMKRRSHVLHKMLDGAVQRRDYGVLAPFLPPKHEYVLFITLTEVQIKLYQHYLDNYSRRPSAGKSSGFLFPDFQSLQRIWTHPLVLKYNSERYEIMQQKKRDKEEEDSEGSLADFIDDESTPDETSTEESSDSLSDASDDSRKKSKKKKSAKKNKGKDSKISTRRGTRANPVELDDDEVALVEESNVKSDNPTEWWMALVNDDELEDLRHSHKLVLLFDILKHCEAIGDKLLVFSQSLYSLDLIEHFLGKVDEATQEGRVDEKLNGHVGSWSPGVDYFRLDGSTSCENRSIWCKNFNKEDNPRARLFLISTRAGGLGINLVAANRVVIFDVSWNPSHDVQSIFRVYRFGQKKPCYVYRFLAMGTMEEKIYERQVTKQAISKRVIDEQQIDRHYAENDLAELYKFEPQPPMPRELPPLPKDRLFAEMLKDHEAQIYKYHEHDSLLENKEEETLTEEERKAAWEDFENEKTRPPPAPFPAYMHNGMLLAQQQQQMAYAALMTMLQKEMPNATDSQIREALFRNNPSMFGGYDYGFAQKLSELYKYTQPMMNPAMMNPVMNPGGVGMGVGGSSGLQYEPPWQRQQQQQQQMRLQQLMHHQNQMGAKFYAGGLGSRDPVAMQLQQQRAREMMLGERARPRGRPPAQPRAPPLPNASSADIVNLDSD